MRIDGTEQDGLQLILRVLQNREVDPLAIDPRDLRVAIRPPNIAAIKSTYS
jgi:hypothetical protein